MKPHHRALARFMAGMLAAGSSVILPAAQPTPAPVAAPVQAVSPSPASADPQADAPKPDATATRYAMTCAGCHSLAGVKLNGPDLTAATAWPLEQLQVAIKRMEKNVGPLTDEQVSNLALFMKAPDVRERVKAEQERIQAQFMAKMAPPDAALGAALFHGREPLRNGGLACAACHAVEGAGGNLGVNLTGVFAKMGGATPLISAIEQSAFKIMGPHYRRHPVTRQEAMHLAEFLSKQDGSRAAATQASFLPLGGGVALAGLLGLVFSLRAQRRTRGRDRALRRRRS